MRARAGVAKKELISQPAAMPSIQLVARLIHGSRRLLTWKPSVSLFITCAGQVTYVAA